MRLAVKILVLLFFFTKWTNVKTIIGKVIQVTDGDTIVVIKKDKKYTIRLNGIDAPEKKQFYGQEVKKTLSNKLLNKTVRIEWTEKDKYGRTLGNVFLDKKSINKWLIEEGYAWHYKKYSKSKILAQLETDAKIKKKGLWQYANPMEPWKFRKLKKKK